MAANPLFNAVGPRKSSRLVAGDGPDTPGRPTRVSPSGPTHRHSESGTGSSTSRPGIGRDSLLCKAPKPECKQSRPLSLQTPQGQAQGNIVMAELVEREGPNTKVKSKTKFQYPSPRQKAKDEEPPDKRRRTDNQKPVSANPVMHQPSDDLWDDDYFDFMTEDQFENIDQAIALSQQVNVASREPAYNVCSSRKQTLACRAVGRGMGRSHSAGEVVQKNHQKVQKKVIQTEGINSVDENLQRSKHPRGSASSSAISETTRSVAYNKLSSSTVPKSSTSKQSGSKELQPKVPTGGAVSTKSQLTPTAGTTCSGQFSPALPGGGGGHGRTEFSDILQSRIKQLTEETDNNKQEIKKLTAIVLNKDGQIKNLRTSLHEKDAENLARKQEKIEFLEKQAIRESERDKLFEKEVERFKTQLQFKEQDIVELQGRCKWFEKLKNVANSQSPSRPGQGCLQAGQSPRARVDQKSPRTSKGNFPSGVTFMADECTPKSKSSQKGTSTPQLDKAETAQRTEGEIQGPKAKSPNPWPCVKVHIPNSRGHMHGPRMMGKMLAEHSKIGTAHPQGIMGLLQVPPKHQDLQELGLHRDMVTHTFSPAKTKRWIQNMQTYSPVMSRQQCGGPVVPEDHYKMALHAVASLLQGDLGSHDPIDVLSSSTDEAVLLLPAIENYLSHYLHLVRAAGEVRSPSQISSIQSSSIEGSIESVTSQLRMLMSDGATYANHMERCALNGLWMLRVLVENSGKVRETLMGTVECAINKTTASTADSSQTLTAQTSGSQQTTSRGNKESGQSKEQPGTPGQNTLKGEEVIPVPNSTPDGATSGREPTQPMSRTAIQLSIGRVVRETQLLTVLMRLANPVISNGQTACAEVVELSFKILAVLGARCSPSQIIRLEPLLRQETLLNCLQEDTTSGTERRLGYHLAAVTMLSVLSRSPDILPKFCTSSESCVLLAVYSLSSAIQFTVPAHQRLQLNLKIIQLISDLMTLSTKGQSLVLQSDCQCSVNVVKTVILLLHEELQEYRRQRAPAALNLLRHGISLLHMMALPDGLFTQHRREVEDRYVELVIGIDNIFRESKGISEHELDGLQVLWDFEFDYPGGTHDGDDGGESGEGNADTMS